MTAKPKPDFPQWAQQIEDRLRRLEGKSRVTVGNWVLEQVGGDVVLTYTPTGFRQQLATPTAEDDTA